MCTNCDVTISTFSGYCPFCNNTLPAISNLPRTYKTWYDYTVNRIIDNITEKSNVK